MNYGIGNVKGKSKALFTTTTAPTISGGVITLATTDIVESGFKVGDYLAYVDSDNISALYSISAISSGTATLSLIGNIGGGGGGKQLYQHTVRGATTYGYHFYMTIINDNNTEINTYNQIKDFVYNNGFTTNASKYYGNVNGITPADSTYYIVDSVAYNSSTQKAICRMYKLNATVSEDFPLDNAMWSFSDTIVAL